MQKDKIYFGENGLTSTSANHIANLAKEYYQTLRNFLTNEYKTKTIYPDKYDIFNALHFTSYKDINIRNSAKLN